MLHSDTECVGGLLSIFPFSAINFVCTLSLAAQPMYTTLYVHCVDIYSYNPIMRVHKTAKPMVLNLLLFCSRLWLCAHKHNRGERYALCANESICTVYCCFCCCCWFFPMLSDLIGSGFSHRSLLYGNFHSDQIYGYTTNIRLQYNKHIATAAFRIKTHCILPLLPTIVSPLSVFPSHIEFSLTVCTMLCTTQLSAFMYT